MFRKVLAAVTGTAALAAVAVTPTAINAQQGRVEVGALECSVSSSIGMIVGSKRNVACYFKVKGVPIETYEGSLTRIGLDIGVTTGGAIVWVVFAGTSRYSGMLTGTYIGATAEMSIAAGLGANVLVGGSSRTVALQPLSVQGQTGLDIAVGVGELELHLAH